MILDVVKNCAIVSDCGRPHLVESRKVCMRVVISHPFGNPNSYHATLAFDERNLLSEYHTCLFTPLGSGYRSFPGLTGSLIRTHPSREVWRLLFSYLPIGRLNGRGQVWVDWAARGLDMAVAESFDKSVEAVYCYEDSALATFRMADKIGVRKFYELASVYQDEARAIACEEMRRDRELVELLTSLHEPEEKVVRKRNEVFLADHIICASTYSHSTLRKHVDVAAKVSVLPYGCDSCYMAKAWSEVDFRGPLKLVFVGRLAPMKGLHYLFRALEKLPPGSFSLTMAGRWVPGYREWLLRRYRVEFTEAGQVPRRRVFDLVRQGHLLVFPSLFDGFGLVLLEAMGCGVPILASERTGAPDIVQEGKEGFLVKAASSEDIADVLSRVLDNREQLAEMGAAARRKASSLSWTEYRRRLAFLVASDFGFAQ